MTLIKRAGICFKQLYVHENSSPGIHSNSRSCIACDGALTRFLDHELVVCVWATIMVLGPIRQELLM